MPFRDILGHERQVDILRRTMVRGKIPHAYLFSGMDGVGKRTTAEVLARALNCLTETDDACECCVSCLKMARGTHPDLLTVRPEGAFIRIREVRALQEQMRFSPFEGRKRVVLMEEAERMNREAANALLKTLEEPQPSNVLILLASRPHQLPRTILSRCQHLPFNPVPTETVARFLRERSLLDGETAAMLASSSGGSIGRAVEMGGESYRAWRDDVLQGMADIRGRDPLGALFLVGRFGTDRDETMRKLDILRGCYRDALVYQETGDRDLLQNGDCVDILQSVTLDLAGPVILRHIQTVERTYRAMEQNVNRQLLLETMAFALAGES